MPTLSGNLRKMKVSLADPVQYQLTLEGESLDMNALLGQPIHFSFAGRINCKVCGRLTKKVFGEGLCYPCFMNAPENSPCIIRPELCEGHLGIGRDPEWEQAHHVQPHVVYLALSADLKVGVTRADQVPTRWIDQGASRVIRLAEVPYRRLAGDIEVALKAHLTDKTHWQKMLKNELLEDVDLFAEKQRIREFIPAELQQYYSANNDITEIHYPVTLFPQKIKSISLDKTPEVQGILQGIKGQYLILDKDRVMNVRKHTGYWVEVRV